MMLRTKPIHHHWIILCTFIWSWLVIALGAFTRLTNSGLGCPDWPGCYGHLVVAKGMTMASRFKAWAEMSHRYVAGILVLGIIASLVLVFINVKKMRPWQSMFAILLLILLAYQPLLGMWTVTLKLHPSIVSQHLLSGYLLMILLGLQWWYASAVAVEPKRQRRWFGWCLAGVVLLLIQILLGAWTSTNYTALSCDTFPFCHMDAWHYRFHEAFNFLQPVGLNYDGGLLSVEAKRTIQVVHRAFALVVAVYWLILAIVMIGSRSGDRLTVWSFAIIAVILLQILLGIGNVVFARPVLIALFHTLMGATLLAIAVWLSFITGSRQRHEWK